ncbi:hypothetical protein KIW84_062973 [Lathyrus oleraceus]|uniref:Uncharacterized protein n=1 Tax=Pisum sativum TaxID=3888 RepID=A0A9D4W7A7_PEA|nr:hypothetical protein KIW84_062973 [Pisum sativum]
MKSGMVSFEDRAPNVKANSLPAHGNSSVNMVDGCPGEFKVFDVRFIRRSLVQMHKDGCPGEFKVFGCAVCSVNLRGCEVVKKDIQRMMDEGMIQIVQSRHIDDDVNVIVSVFKQPEKLVTRSGRVFGLVFPKDKEEAVVSKKVEVPIENPVGCSKDKSGESSNLKPNDDDDDERVLEQAFVENDVTVDQFDHIVANITYCNNLSFCDEELPEEGRNHNLALHISTNCKEDALSNVLVDTGSSLNVLPKSTLSKLSYEGAPMRYSGVIVKAFNGSRKTVIGEVDLPIKIGPSDFQITFQVMDIHPTYSCLLGRPWIHEAGAVTSTLHQKLKFMKNGKLVIVGGEKALLVSHLSSFSYVEAEDEVGTLF